MGVEWKFYHKSNICADNVNFVDHQISGCEMQLVHAIVLHLLTM